MERVIGFEPMINGFADRRLGPLGYTRNRSGTRGEIRTPNILFLRQAPLPIWPRVREIFGQSGRIRTCERLLPRQARLASAERSVRKFGFGSRIRTSIYWFRASRPAG